MEKAFKIFILLQSFVSFLQCCVITTEEPPSPISNLELAQLSCRNQSDDWARLDHRIVGGQDARPHEFKWLVSMTYWGRHVCAATIISEEWVVTAAHCIYRRRLTNYRFIAGEYNIRNPNEGTEKVRSAEFSLVHPDYDQTWNENDIALVKLSIPYSFDPEAVMPACLPLQYEHFTGSSVVTGWGSTREGGLNSDILKKVWVPLLTDIDCRRLFTNTFYSEAISHSMICAGLKEGGKDACQGDSGGPLVYPGIENSPLLVGVVSWGIGCARANLPGIYTEVSYYVDWIKNMVEKFDSRTFDLNQRGGEMVENGESRNEENSGEILNYSNANNNKFIFIGGL